MAELEAIIEDIQRAFETRTRVRDEMLKQARYLTRHCAHAIRAIHRQEFEQASQQLAQAGALADELTRHARQHPDLYYAGYTQDALKEYAEAHLTMALVRDTDLPTPEELQVDIVAYIKGLAEAAGELRRRCLDVLRHNDAAEANRLLDRMDDIYAALVTMDYPDAVTGGLRRLTDVLRSLLERTRGDLTMSLRQQRLEKQLQRFEELIKRSTS
ncbi:MAG: haloacid dehalogenase [Anaerolineae bacterium]|nr:MAG: haloacid dehalogenase [Anaerolineae bacterium]